MVESRDVGLPSSLGFRLSAVSDRHVSCSKASPSDENPMAYFARHLRAIHGSWLCVCPNVDVDQRAKQLLVFRRLLGGWRQVDRGDLRSNLHVNKPGSNLDNQ